MSNKIKCSICEEEIGEDCETFSTIEGEIACEGCYESAWENPSTIVQFSPSGDREGTSFTNEFGTLENNEIPDPIERELWVKTDGWRGYTDWEIAKGYVKIGDGWITGFPDSSVQRKIDLHEIFSDLQDEKIKPPCDMFWVFGKTSNLFSTSCIVVVRGGDVEEIEKWLNEIDGGIEGLKKMLS